MADWKLIHEYVQTLLSAPVIGGIVLLVLLCMFRADIKALMKRIGKIRLPGGSEFSVSQSGRNIEEPSERPDPPPVESEDLPENLNLSPEELQIIVEFVQAERTNARLWEYRYLNLYLVPKTQWVLDRLASSNQSFSEELLDNYLRPIVQSANERLAIYNALESNVLIQNVNGLIQVTEKGREYIGWRGPTPSIPTGVKA